MDKNNEKYSEIWLQLIQIHNITKELYIKSEEYSDELYSFIQPIKEQRDAYEHVIRAQANFYSLDRNDAYIMKNLSKAMGHEYRAFFDTADFMSIILRSKMVDRLKAYRLEEILSVYPEYRDMKRDVTEIADQIVQLRMKKDIGNVQDIYDLIIKYKKVIESLIEYYRTVDEEICFRLAKKNRD